MCLAENMKEVLYCWDLNPLFISNASCVWLKIGRSPHITTPNVLFSFSFLLNNTKCEMSLLSHLSTSVRVSPILSYYMIHINITLSLSLIIYSFLLADNYQIIHINGMSSLLWNKNIVGCWNNCWSLRTFQKKIVERMEMVQRKGTTVSVLNIAPRALYLKKIILAASTCLVYLLKNILKNNHKFFFFSRIRTKKENHLKGIFLWLSQERSDDLQRQEEGLRVPQNDWRPSIHE